MEEIKDYQDSMKFDPMKERINFNMSPANAEMLHNRIQDQLMDEQERVRQYRREHKLCVNDWKTGVAHDGENFYCKHCLKQIRKEHRKPKAYPITGYKSIGRNDPCPCGSGRKYKQCCLGSQKIG